ncbi:hypothetical protein [Runella sp.]|jgi:hypothetical protein|uniref:hypothetical protein n=1 Tax=Runella sp. TaxID=1960881 RepID=UPI0026286A32|nr:hypothetical protein [Runella sp.]
MKKVILCLLLPIYCIGQKDYSNYEIEGKKLYWRKVFENVSMSADSLQKMVKRQILTKGLKLQNEEQGLVQARFEDYTIYQSVGFVKMPLVFNAGVTVQFKEGKYRVELSEMLITYGNSKSPQDASFMKTDSTFRTRNDVLKIMSERNEEFIGIFKLKSGEKKDW